MGYAIQDVIGYVPLMRTIREQVNGLPKVLPDGFYNVTDTTTGNIASYTKIPGERTLSKRVEYGAPSIRRDQNDIASQPVTLVHTFEHITFSPSVLMNLRAYDDYRRQDMGRQEIARQTLMESTRIQNLRTAAITLALSKGQLWFDKDGNVLPSSSGATLTVNFNVPSGNQNQLDVFGTGAIINASWATATTDIPGHIRKIKKAAIKLTGYPLRYAFYGEDVPGYMTTNNFVKDYLARNPTRQDAFLASADLPDGLFGLTWVPVYTSFWIDSSAAFQDSFQSDNVIFTPEPSPDWWGMIEGTYPVPTTLNVAGEGAAAADNVKEVQGMFGYGQVISDPVGIKCMYGDNFLPVIKNGKAVFLGDIVP